MEINFLSIDFEYNNSNNPRYNLVSVALFNGAVTKSTWLESNDIAKQQLKNLMKEVRSEGIILLSFNVDAEARSLIALGLNPIKFKWIDIQAEWKMLINHCDKWRYGKHFFDGKIKTTQRLRYGEEKGRGSYDQTPINLLATTYKLLGGVTEADYIKKGEMRDLIIHQSTWTDEEKKAILDYGAGDVKDLHAMYEKIFKELKKLYGKRRSKEQLLQDMLWRGETVARAAVIAATGYPVNREDVTNFTNNIPDILISCQEDINAQFPETPIFRWNKKENRYALNTKVITGVIATSEYAKQWPKTPTKRYEIGVKPFEKFFSWRHDFPRDNIFAQYYRYLKLGQSLNGFKPKGANAKNKKTFFSHYGNDDRAHPYLNAYGSQSSRYQPKATGFLHLKAAWMRSMVQPKPGKAIASIDYKSEEFFIAALMSGDMNMIRAYQSGDVYLYFAKLAGAVPWDGTKKKYKKERDRFKSTVLGLSYGMGARSLANKLTVDTGVKHTLEEAKDLTNKFWEAFPDYAIWVDNFFYFYQDEEMVILPDGWTMFGDNDNPLSSGNMPIQGFGGCILRKAIQFCQDSGINVILPLHDALYIEYEANDTNALKTFAKCMRMAFAWYFDGDMKEIAYEDIGLDIDTWSPDYRDQTVEIPSVGTVNFYQYYIDERSINEYKTYSKYFKTQ